MPCPANPPAVLRWAMQMGLLVRNPADSVDPPRYQHKEMVALDPEKFAVVLAAAHGTELQDAIVVAVGTDCDAVNYLD